MKKRRQVVSGKISKQSEHDDQVLPTQGTTNAGKETLTVTSFELIRGPLPPPSVLAAYRQIDPDFPSRIMTMAEHSQQMANREMDLIEKQVEASGRSMARLISMSFVSLIVLIVAVVVLGALGAKEVAVVLAQFFGGGGALVGLLQLLITARNKPPKD